MLVGRQRKVARAVDRDLVPDLQVLGRHGPSVALKPGDLVRIRVAERADLRERDALQEGRKVGERSPERCVAGQHLVGDRHQRGTVALDQCVEDGRQVAPVDHAEHLSHRRLVDPAGAERDRLVEQRQGVAHAARRGAADQRQRLRVGGNAFGLEHVPEVPRNGRGGHVLQVELQAARQDGDRHLLRIGGGQDEGDVRRRLLERLQHRVERVRRQHVDLVDHVDLVASRDRRVDRVVQQLRHLVDAAIRSRVEFQIIREAPLVDLAARPALSAGLSRNARLAVQRLGEDPGDRGLADAACAGEQVGVMQTTGLQRMSQRPDDVLLPDQRREVARPPLPG